jgi:UDP:flavonoid glycosyltransferase YjiC (YdhE family)
MARIFIVTTGLNGILNASFEMARRLRLAGHEVSLGAPRSVGDKVEEEGLSFVEFPFIDTDPAPPLPEGGGKVRRTWLRFRDRKERRAAALESYRPHAFREAIERLNPDLLLIDIELHEYIFAAYEMKRSFVLLSQWYSTWRRPGLPYLLTDAIPGVGEEGTPAAINAHWEKVRKQRTKMFAKMALLSSWTDRRSTLLALAEECGFPRDLIVENWWPGVFTYNDLPAISMTPFELEFPHEPRKALHYVGPMVHENRTEKNAVSHGGQEMETLLTEAEAANAKLILTTVSSLHAGDVGFLRRLIEAVSTETGWRLIIGLGGKLDPVELGGMPANVHTFAYVPQLRVLRNAALSINHAGIHTIHECIHFGVPQLIYSGKRSDQPGCAARVHYHGLGLMADKDTDSVEEIRRNIEEVLTNDDYRKATRQLREACDKYAAERKLENTISSFLNDET